MRQLFTTWRDEQAKGVYPFDGNGSFISVDANLVPPGIILDAAIHPPGLIEVPHVSRIIRSSGKVTIEIVGGDSRCEGSWPMAGATDSSVIDLVDASDRASGVLVIDPAAMRSFLMGANDEIQLGLGDMRFVLSVIEFTSLPPDETEDVVELGIREDEYLIGENGVLLTCESRQETIGDVTVDAVAIRVNAVGDPLGARATCDDVLFNPPRFIREIIFQKDDKTITCAPSGVGEIFIVSASLDDNETALRITVDSQGLVVGLAGKTSETNR